VQLENENGIGFSVSLPSICFKAKSGRLVLAGALTSTDIYLEGGDSLIHLDEVENRFKVSHES
jgi:hypothetical protein